MSFDFDHLHIDAGSPEGQSLQAIVQNERVTPEEAIRRALLRQAAVTAEVPPIGLNRRRGPRPPNLEVAATQSVIGMYADRPDLTAAIDAVVASRAERYAKPL